MTVPLPPAGTIPNAWQLTLRLQQGGQDCAIVLGAQAAANVNMLTQAPGWRDRAWNHFRGMMVDDVTCLGAVVRGLDTNRREVYELGQPPLPTGGLTGTLALLAASTLVRWRTANGTRSGKGRTYVPGVSAGRVNPDGRTQSAGAITENQTWVNGYLTDSALATAGIVPAVLSFKNGVAYPILSGTAQPVIGLQRRRMR